MRTEEISFSYRIHPDTKSLSSTDNALLDEAIHALTSAYAPYSKFKVAAAIRTTNGKTITGSNQENGSFPVGQCAERVAIYRMIHEHGRKAIDSIAIIVEHEGQTSPASPCGSCRQLLMEHRNEQSNPIRLLLASSNGNEVYEIDDVRDLLPLSFDGTFLGV